MDNKETLKIVSPVHEDPLYCTLLKVSEDIKDITKKIKEEKINFKLKSRLLIEEENPIVSRCGDCNSILV
jgi:hypothetical protein